MNFNSVTEIQAFEIDTDLVVRELVSGHETTTQPSTPEVVWRTQEAMMNNLLKWELSDTQVMDGDRSWVRVELDEMDQSFVDMFYDIRRNRFCNRQVQTARSRLVDEVLKQWYLHQEW